MTTPKREKKRKKKDADMMLEFEHHGVLTIRVYCAPRWKKVKVGAASYLPYAKVLQLFIEKGKYE